GPAKTGSKPPFPAAPAFLEIKPCVEREAFGAYARPRQPEASMDIQVLSPAIGAVIKGADLSQKLSDGDVAEIRKALLKHQVIFFEDQHLTPVQHRDFASRFGALHTHPLYPGVEEAKELFILDNHAGNPTDNDAWHTDVTFIETPPMGSILYAEHPPVVHPVIRTHPETGEDGLFVNYGFTSRILGVSRKESAAILKLLHEHIQQPEYLVRWRWTPNAIAFWDNRVTQHYAIVPEGDGIG